MGGMTTAEHRRNLKKNPIKMLKKTLSMFRKKPQTFEKGSRKPRTNNQLFYKELND